MTSLLMSSPPISFLTRLFRCRYSNSRDVVASSPSFFRPAARAPRRTYSFIKLFKQFIKTLYGVQCGEFVCEFCLFFLDLRPSSRFHQPSRSARALLTLKATPHVMRLTMGMLNLKRYGEYYMFLNPLILNCLG